MCVLQSKWFLHIPQQNMNRYEESYYNVKVLYLFGTVK